MPLEQMMVAGGWTSESVARGYIAKSKRGRLNTTNLLKPNNQPGVGEDEKSRPIKAAKLEKLESPVSEKKSEKGSIEKKSEKGSFGIEGKESENGGLWIEKCSGSVVVNIHNY